MISIVIPCFNEQDSIKIIYQQIVENIKDFEIIFIDDGSKDNTLKEIKKITDDRVKYIAFSRNFGKEAALLAGLKKSQGDFICQLDSDLQHPITYINDMMAKISDEVDVVVMKRNRKDDPFISTILSKLFYYFINKVGEVKLIDGAGDFRLMKRKVVDSLIEFNEFHRFGKGLYAYVGFKTAFIEYDNQPRLYGKTKFNFKKRISYAIMAIISYSDVFLKMATFLGIITSIGGFIYMGLVFFQKIFQGIEVSGYASTLIIILFLGGMQLISLGIIGEYLGKIYIQSKNRPQYIIDEQN